MPGASRRYLFGCSAFLPALVSHMPLRDYTHLLSIAGRREPTPRVIAMRDFLEAVWRAFGDDHPSPERKSISWIGFYERDPAGHNQMILIDRRPKPACSPIGLHGLCGRGMLDAATHIVDDVRVLGADYVACDPRDQSELVVPLVDDSGTCFGVLDADSFAIGGFDKNDATCMHMLLVEYELTKGRHPQVHHR